MAVGTIQRFDDVRGYGFIAPSVGGQDVFVHANDFGEDRHRVRPGLKVVYEVAKGDRGLKVASVRLADADQPTGDAPDGTDDGDCDVLSARAFTASVTEMLITDCPSLTAAQAIQIRQRFLAFARSHGWVDG